MGGEYINLNWQFVDNTLSKRMVEGSLIHLLDTVKRKMSKRTIVLNQKLKQLHSLKSYEHFVKVKTKINKKIRNDEDEYESSSTEEVPSKESDLNDIQDAKKSIEHNKQSSQHENEEDMLPKDKSDNSIPVDDAAPQLTDNEEPNKSETDDPLIEDSKSSCNNDSLLENHSDMMSDDDTNKLVIDENSAESFMNVHDNNDTEENHSDVISNDESNERDIHDNSTGDSINSPKSDDITENHDENTCRQKDKPNLKIIMTEIVKPRYTVIKTSQTEVNTTNQFIELSADNDNIKLESSQRNDSLESNENDTNDENSIDSTKTENPIIIKKRVKKTNKRIKRKNIILSNDNYNLESHSKKISVHTNDSDTHFETLNTQMVDDKVDDFKMMEGNVNFTKKTEQIDRIKNSRSKSPVSEERAALAYTLEHMDYVKHRQEKLNYDSQLSNENYINIENESREDSLSEQENDQLQSNVLGRRPITLDEFVQENNLVSLDKRTSAFTLDDLSEDDEIFLMEMPKSVIDQELLGQKMIVRNFEMTIGNTNYQLQRLKNDALTCILKENNDRESFRAVNIKPKRTFMVKQMFAPSTGDICFHQTFHNTNNRCPFPKNLKIRNPLENTNKRLKKYKKKMRKEKKNMKF